MFNTYTTIASARSAIRRAGLAAMIVRYDNATGRFAGAKSVLPVVLCDLVEDVFEVQSRGFSAEIKRTEIQQGATVYLKPGVTGTAPGLAVVKAMLDDTEGGVFLDRPLGGCRYWNTEDLILIAREEEEVT